MEVKNEEILLEMISPFLPLSLFLSLALERRSHQYVPDNRHPRTWSISVTNRLQGCVKSRPLDRGDGRFDKKKEKQGKNGASVKIERARENALWEK